MAGEERSSVKRQKELQGEGRVCVRERSVIIKYQLGEQLATFWCAACDGSDCYAIRNNTVQRSPRGQAAKQASYRS